LLQIAGVGDGIKQGGLRLFGQAILRRQRPRTPVTET
jgi:hypothetical protein